MSTRLYGKVAIVTGAGSGIGAATARLFRREGAAVVVADVSGNEKAVADELGEHALAVHTDVANAADVESLVQTTLDRFGRLDVLYNNAGIDGDQAPTGEYPEQEWDRVLAVNLKGVFLGMRFGIPAMLRTGGGSIISTASMAATVAFANMPAYCASKAGIVMLTKTAAVEYADRGIRANAILPGVISTGMTPNLPADLIAGIEAATPLKRIAQPEEVANLALFLAGDESSFVTGESILVDGGYSAH
ncbi:SDR family NAD(P)-dependent oxidoreductase [Nocardia sp. NPDC004123]